MLARDLFCWQGQPWWNLLLEITKLDISVDNDCISFSLKLFAYRSYWKPYVKRLWIRDKAKADKNFCLDMSTLIRAEKEQILLVNEIEIVSSVCCKIAKIHRKLIKQFCVVSGLIFWLIPLNQLITWFFNKRYI